MGCVHVHVYTCVIMFWVSTCRSKVTGKTVFVILFASQLLRLAALLIYNCGFDAAYKPFVTAVGAFWCVISKGVSQPYNFFLQHF